MKATLFVLYCAAMTQVGFAEQLTLANVSGRYRATEGVAGYDATKYSIFECKALDKGNDPLFRRVQIAFTFYWIGHKNAIGLRGVGIGRMTKEGSLPFSFVDEDGRHGTGLFQPQNREYIVTLRTLDKIAHDMRDVDKRRSVYNQTFTFVRRK